MISMCIKSMPNRNHDKFTSVKIAPEIIDLSLPERRDILILHRFQSFHIKMNVNNEFKNIFR